jgi:hypothetical protein
MCSRACPQVAVVPLLLCTTCVTRSAVHSPDSYRTVLMQMHITVTLSLQPRMHIQP